MRLFLLSIFSCGMLLFDLAASETSATIDYSSNSSWWHKHNGHLIPSQSESKAIASLDFTAVANKKDNDFDGDGVINQYDPSPYDWRETGYNPFATLEFLSWRHTWNNFKYDTSKLKKIIALLKEAGVTMVRFDFYWNDIEPEKGKFDFKKYDEIVEAVSRANIRILGIIDYSADWSASSWNNPPRNLEQFAEFSKIIVNRYKNRVKYWEIWNEPDSPTYWVPQDGMKIYAQLLKLSYAAIKNEDPSSKVLLGGLTKDGIYALKYLYKHGVKDCFDIMNYHPFINPLDKDYLKQIKFLYFNIRKIMSANGDDVKPVWFTEAGCPGVCDYAHDQGWWMGKSPLENQQAEFVKGLYRQIIDLEGVDKVFWAFFRDNKDHFCNSVDNFGLVRWDFSKKPGFLVYKNAAKEWSKRHENFMGTSN